VILLSAERCRDIAVAALRTTGEPAMPTDSPNPSPEAVDRVARAICREKCASYGEPPCFTLEDDDGNLVPWPNPHCDEPGCGALAVAALLATPVQQEPGDDA
jgi:hypothetical protein